MRSSVFILLVILVFGSCTKESSVDPGNTNTFIRYFNGGQDDIAISVQETPDNGYIILANSSIRPNDVTGEHFKVKLIKTDAFGAVEWQRVYPGYDSDTYQETVGAVTTTYKTSQAGYGLLILPDNAGYVVVGEDIKTSTASGSVERFSQLLVMSVDANGENAKPFIIPGRGVRGRGVARDTNGNLLVLAQNNSNMILREYNPTTLALVWSREYEAGTINNLVNKIFTNAQGNVYWGGTVTKVNSATKIRFIKTTQDSDIVDSDPVIGNPQFNETGRDICRYGFGFAVIGTTNQKGSQAGDQDILFRRLAEDGSEVPGQTKSFPVAGRNATDLTPTADMTGNEEGNSIFASRDGGLILLGTVDSQVTSNEALDSKGNAGRGDKDLYMIKVNAFGDVEWTQIFGSKFEDLGASIIQSSDGGYIVLGTANVSNSVKTVMMLKTDKNGNIE